MSLNMYTCEGVRICMLVCVRARDVYSVCVRECALMHANVCVCANISVFVFFVFVQMNSERECLYSCRLVQNVYVCR